MRIRSIYFNNFRSFRGEHTISFVDPLTDEARPISVIAGSNGTGKTTIFEAIESLLAFALQEGPYDHHQSPSDILREAWASGCISLQVELDKAELGNPSLVL